MSNVRLSDNAPTILERDKRKLSNEELLVKYKELRDYYKKQPFDDKACKKNERNYVRLAEFFKLIAKAKGTVVLHKERIPEKTGILYVSNHVGSFDQFFETIPLDGKKLHYLINSKVTTWPIRWNLIYKPTGVIVVDQSSMSSWKEAKAKMTQLLLNGKDVVAYPQGTRSGEGTLTEFRPGIIQLAQEAGAPIQTLAIKNVDRLKSLKTPIISVGDLIEIDPKEGAKEATARVASSVARAYNEAEKYEVEHGHRLMKSLKGFK